MQLQNLENELLGKILAFKSYFVGKMFSLKDEINNNVQKLATENQKERIKYLESEKKFLKYGITNKQKLIGKVLENNNKLVGHQHFYVPFQYI